MPEAALYRRPARWSETGASPSSLYGFASQSPKQRPNSTLQHHRGHPTGQHCPQQWSVLADCLDAFPPQVEGLAQFLCERLQDTPHAIPTQIKTLSKIDHIRGTEVIDPAKLVQAVQKMVVSEPQIAALINWENRVSDAAADTIAQLVNLVPSDKRDTPALVVEIGRLLNALATEAVGASNVGKDRFAAVNEALLPILYDRVSRLRMAAPDERLWKQAIATPGKKADLSDEEAAHLNTMLHVDLDVSAVKPTDRGVVLECPAATLEDAPFREAFGMDTTSFLRDQLSLDPTANVRWILVQIEGICDYAQAQAGPALYVLGVETSAKQMKVSPQAVWQSPILAIENEQRQIFVNYRFCRTFTDALVKANNKHYRLREALTNDLVSRFHSYGARPGIIAFRQASLPKLSSAVAATPPESQDPGGAEQKAKPAENSAHDFTVPHQVD
ncbi:hypothetical protein ACFQBQ_03555 [Granulicella cerasi]|uniref:Uncharacterized protein n=1 Tax=Granulicella cerasi TaxID=741063 RepID=A0ABW1Z7N2_9BACT